MTTLATDAIRSFEIPDRNDLPVIAADIIYEGAAVGDNGSGYARPLVAGDPFRGFALEKADNAAGAAGDINVHLITRGRVQLAVGSVAITDVGKPVYASDDNAFTLTSSTNSYVGRVVRFISTGVCIVEFDAARGGLSTLAVLTDSSTGTSGGDTIGAVSSTATAANGIATLGEKVNAIIKFLR